MTPAGRGLLAGCALGLASGWNIGNVGAVASRLAQTYGVGLATVGLLTTALLVTHTAIQIPGGRASDRFGADRAGILAAALIMAGTLAALTSPEPAVGIAARALTGIGTGLAFIAGSALVRQTGGSPFTQGLFGGVSLGAAGLALAVVPQLAGVLGWRAPFWTALLMAALAMAVTIASRPAPARIPPPRGASSSASSRSGVAFDSRLHRLALLYSASYGLSVVVGNWAVEVLTRHGTMGESGAAVVGGLTLILAVASRPLGGWILRAYPQFMVAALAGSLLCGAAGTMALAVASPTWLAVAGGILVGLGAGIPFAAAFTGAALARPDAPAAAVGLVNGVANAVVLTATPIVGLALSSAGGGRVAFVVIGFLWLAALPVLPGRA